MDPQAMLQKLLALTFSLLLLSTCTTQAAEVQKSELKEPIKVIGIPNYYPFVIQLPDGQASGLYVEFWQLWSETTGIPVEFVFGPPGENITRMAESERHVLNIFKTESREAIADFSIPIHAVQTGVVYSRDYLVNTPFDSLQNKRIAVMRGSQQYQYLKENYPNHSFLVYLNLEEGIQKLFDGHVDALVGELPSIKNTLTRLGYMGILPVSNEVLYTNTVHAAIAKGQTGLLNTINQGINEMPINQIIELEKKWLPLLPPYFETRSLRDTLTDEEKEWLNQHQNITIGMDDNLPPFEFINANGEFDGIAAEYIQYASDALGVTFTPRTDLTWLEAFAEMKAGRVDMMSAAIVIESRQNDMFFTEPYVEMDTAIVVHRDNQHLNSMDNLDGTTLGLVEGDFVNFVYNDYPGINVKILESEVEGLELLSVKEIDAFIAPVAVANYEIDKRGLRDLRLVSFSPYDLKLGMAISPTMEPLAKILNKTFARMSQKERQAIENTWLKAYVPTGLDALDIMKWLAPITVLFLLSIIYVYRRNNLHLSRILERNRTLAGRIVAIQEEERKVLSRDLHDEIGQNLTALRYHIGAAKNIDDPKDLKEMIATIDNIASITYRSSYELMHWLRPLVLDDYGLEHALSNHIIVKLLEDAKISYHKTVMGDLDQLPQEISTNVYRIIQECITNAAKYSKASNLWVAVSYSGTDLTILIRDDGSGFDPINFESSKGLGIEGIKDRLEAINGHYELQSNSSGTTFHFHIHLDKP